MPAAISGVVRNDFQLFSALPTGGSVSAQSDNGAGGRDPRLAQLDMAMAQAGLGGSAAGSGDISAQGFGDFFRDVVNTGRKVYDAGRTVYNAGRSLGLFSDGPDGEFEAQFLDTFLKTQVQDLINTLHQYVNRYGNLVECVPLVTRCVQQFGNKQYAAALATGYQAYNCIQSKI